MSCPQRRAAQRGFALILMATVLILGVAWFTVGALGQVNLTTAAREQKTGAALEKAKRALLAYVAQTASDTSQVDPGRMPCPEALSHPGTSYEGMAADQTTPFQSGALTCPSPVALGRLPWKTIGTDQIRDGYGELLWYAVGTGTWAPVNNGSTLTINPGTAGTLTFTSETVSTTVVAVIVAPGPALFTAGLPAAPCTVVNQSNRTASVPYVTSNFLECGNASGSTFTNVGPTSQWGNDRIISITAAEVMDAISGAVADRMQRQVVPALETWRSTTSVASWGQSFMPFASSFSNPTSNDMCGDPSTVTAGGTSEGLPPTVTFSTATSTPVSNCIVDWRSASATGLGGLLSPLTQTCTITALAGNQNRIQCSFTVIGGVVGQIIAPTITATANNVAYAFRSFGSAQVTVRKGSAGNPYQAATIQGLSGSVSSATGRGTISFQVQIPALTLSDILSGAAIRIRITNATDGLSTDSRVQWYLNNGWDRYSYYAAAQAMTANPGAFICTAANKTGCLTVAGWSTSNNDKRFLVVLTGRQLSSQTWPSSTLANYLEGGNLTTGDRTFDATSVSTTFNDRVSACPFTATPAVGSALVLC